MAEVKWIKIVTNLFDDEKIMLIESLPEGDKILVIWFKLLILAGKQNNSGVFIFANSMPYTDEMFATIFRRTVQTVRLALETFKMFGMIEIINNAVTIPNWSKHQTLDQLENKNEYMKKYMQGYRMKQKRIANGEEKSVKVNSKTNSKANVSSLELDIDKELDIDILDKYDKYDKRARESDESNLTHFTNLLIWNKYISHDDLDLMLYDDFFREMTKTFAFNEVKKMTNYFIRKVTNQDTVLENKFGYFKTSMTNSIREFEKKMNQA